MRARWRLIDQQKWFELLVELLGAGFSLKEAINFSTTIYPNQAVVVNEVEAKMAKGMSFAKSLQDQVSVDTYYQLLLAEQHGELLGTLKFFSQYLKARHLQAQKLRHLLQYPIMLLGLLGVIGVVMSSLVWPQLTELQVEGHQHRVWDSVVPLVAWGCGALVAMIMYRYLAYRRLIKINQIRALCSLPIVGRLYRSYYGYYLCSNLALLLGEGLTLQKIVQMCNNFDQKSFLYQVSLEIQSRITAGKMIADYVQKECFMPTELAVLLQQGKDNQQFAKRVQSLSNHLFQRVIMGCESSLIWVQPLLYLIVAGIIVGLYLHVLMPIYQTMQVMK